MTARSPGEKRRRRLKRERERAAYQAAMVPLRAAGCSCDACTHYGRCSLGWHCEIESDFGGYALKKPTDLCPSWAARRMRGIDPPTFPVNEAET